MPCSFPSHYQNKHQVCQKSAHPWMGAGYLASVVTGSTGIIEWKSELGQAKFWYSLWPTFLRQHPFNRWHLHSLPCIILCGGSAKFPKSKEFSCFFAKEQKEICLSCPNGHHFQWIQSCFSRAQTETSHLYAYSAHNWVTFLVFPYNHLSWSRLWVHPMISISLPKEPKPRRLLGATWDSSTSWGIFLPSTAALKFLRRSKFSGHH